MIELTVYNYLKANANLPVEMEVPKNPPKDFYVVEKTGGGIDEHLGKSTIIVQSYGATLYKAAENSEAVVNLMLGDLLKEPDVCKVTLNSQYNYTDTTEKKYRYQAVFDIVHY